MAASLIQLWFDTEHGRDSVGGASRALGRAARSSSDLPSTPLLPPPTLDAFEQLYRERFEALCDYAYTFLRSRDEAWDVVQDVFVRAWHRREDVWARGTPLPYLVTSTRNAALNALRRRNLEHRHALTLVTDVPVQETASDTESLLDRVYEFIETLPPRSREVLTLRWRQGLSLEQIATAMGIGIASVRVTHARALAMLRDRLDAR